MELSTLKAVLAQGDKYGSAIKQRSRLSGG